MAYIDSIDKAQLGQGGRENRGSDAMGILDFFADRERSAELRESKDEMLIGEIVRAMSYKGCPTVGFTAGMGYQRVKFKAPQDRVLTSIYVQLDRLSGNSALTSAVIGSKATLYVTCEVRNFLADPDDLVAMYRTDMANLFKISWKEVRINHEYNAIHGTTKKLIELDNYIGKGPQGVQAMIALLDGEIQRIRTRLEPYKKGEHVL